MQSEIIRSASKKPSFLLSKFHTSI